MKMKVAKKLKKRRKMKAPERKKEISVRSILCESNRERRK